MRLHEPLPIYVNGPLVIEGEMVDFHCGNHPLQKGAEPMDSRNALTSITKDLNIGYNSEHNNYDIVFSATPTNIAIM